jgi:hypothetical protein
MLRLEKLLGFFFWKDFLKSRNFETFKSSSRFLPFANEILNHNFSKVSSNTWNLRKEAKQSISNNRKCESIYEFYMDCDVQFTNFLNYFIWSMQTILSWFNEGLWK